MDVKLGQRQAVAKRQPAGRRIYERGSARQQVASNLCRDIRGRARKTPVYRNRVGKSLELGFASSFRFRSLSTPLLPPAPPAPRNKLATPPEICSALCTLAHTQTCRLSIFHIDSADMFKGGRCERDCNYIHPRPLPKSPTHLFKRQAGFCSSSSDLCDEDGAGNAPPARDALVARESAVVRHNVHANLTLGREAGEHGTSLRTVETWVCMFLT